MVRFERLIHSRKILLFIESLLGGRRKNNKRKEENNFQETRGRREDIPGRRSAALFIEPSDSTQRKEGDLIDHSGEGEGKSKEMVRRLESVKYTSRTGARCGDAKPKKGTLGETTCSFGERRGKNLNRLCPKWSSQTTRIRTRGGRPEGGLKHNEEGLDRRR